VPRALASAAKVMDCGWYAIPVEVKPSTSDNGRYDVTYPIIATATWPVTVRSREGLLPENVARG